MGLECSLLTQPPTPAVSSSPGVLKPPATKQYRSRLDQLQSQMERMMQIMRSQGVNDLVLLSLPDGTPSLQPQIPLSRAVSPPTEAVHRDALPAMQSMPVTLTESLQKNHNGIKLPPLNYRLDPTGQGAHYMSPVWPHPGSNPAPRALVQATSQFQDHIHDDRLAQNYADGPLGQQFSMFDEVNTGLFFQASPANFLTQILKPSYTPQVYRELIVPTHGNRRGWRDLNRSNPITENILTMPQTIGLVTHFRDNFNHWINLPSEMPVSELVEYLLSESSLLLTLCCAVALRYGRPELRAKVHAPLLKHLHIETMRARMHLRQNVEFLQSMVILANFSESLSSSYCLYDPWFVSSWGIQHLTNLMSITDESSLQMRRLWNHLAIAHLYSCNSTGRRCILSADSIRSSREILKIPQSNQFDACILAEISAQFAAYRFFNSHISHDAVEDELHEWEAEWSFLTSEERTIQFASGVHTYIRFMVKLHQLLRQTGHRSASPGVNMVVLAFESVSTEEICEQIQHLSSVPRLLLERVSEDLFAYLGDQLQQLGFLCCVLALQLASLASRRSLTAPQATLLQRALELVDSLALRFQKVSQGSDDLHATSAAALFDFKSRILS